MKHSITFLVLAGLATAACSASSGGGSAPANATKNDGGAEARPSCAASPEVTLVSESEQFISSLAVDATHVYYTTEPMGETPTVNVLKRAPLAGGEPEELARAGRSLEIALTSDRIYWVVSGNGRQELRMVAKSGGATELVSTSDESPTRIVRGANDDIYFDSYPDGRITRLKPNGAKSVVVPETREHLGTFLLDGDSLFVTQVAAQSFDKGFVGETSLYSVPVSGGEPKTLYGPFEQENLGRIAVDANDIYVGRAHAIARMPKGGGEAVLIETGAEVEARQGTIIGGAFELRVDADSLYWLEMNVSSSPTTGNVVRKRKSGAPRDVLADRVALPQNLELDACHVYWTGQEQRKTSIHRIGK